MDLKHSLGMDGKLTLEKGNQHRQITAVQTRRYQIHGNLVLQHLQR
jgi:hypothetical protein